MVFSSAAMLLVIYGLVMVSGTGAVCLLNSSYREARMLCPLTLQDRWATRNVVIRHSFNNGSNPVTVFGCDWFERDPHNPDCTSRFNFTLVSMQTDCVIVTAPEAQLHKNGSYKSQMVPPPDQRDPFNLCVILQSGADGGSPRENFAAFVALMVINMRLSACLLTSSYYAGDMGTAP